ncbi:hypothetical protein C8Q77DRAFT_706374 [Trametes polyzona]|nr:hypothetical protein C8Q77DRAFT_706374 [Trametes polyzona]
MASLRSALGSTSRSCRSARAHGLCKTRLASRSLSAPTPTQHPNIESGLRQSALGAPFLASTGGPQPGTPNTGNDRSNELSDQEWEIRTGRGIYILQQTLPTFFSTGLISSLDTSRSGSGTKTDDDTSIYSPNIRLVYHPPTPFPPPFPRTLQIEGLSLYLASSVILRHTLNALYTDLRVELQRVRVYGPRSSSTSGLSADSPPSDGSRPLTSKTRSIREKSLFVGIVVRGTNRVSKAESGWEVNSTYTFSPITGLIHLHSIDSIHPAPHQAFFDALQAVLSKIGLGSPPGEGAGGMARTSSHPHAQPHLKHAVDRS